MNLFQEQKLKNVPRKWKILYSEERSQELLETYINWFDHQKFDVKSDPMVGEIVKGVITSITKDEAFVDIATKQPAVLLKKNEPKDWFNAIRPGDQVELQIKELNEKGNRHGIVASWADRVSTAKTIEIKEAIGQPYAFEGKVISLIPNGGYWVSIDGIECFMPGSLADVNKLSNFEEILGKTITVKAINWSPEKNCIVVSRKDYLEDLIPAEVQKLEIGKWYSGKVTGISKHGVFVQFNSCLTGLLNPSELSDDLKEAFGMKTVRAGDEISFRVKEIITDRKIVLTQDANWVNEFPYTEGEKIKTKIASFVKGGVIVELEDGMTVFVKVPHKKILSYKKGDEVETQIKSAEKTKRKLVLSIS